MPNTFEFSEVEDPKSGDSRQRLAKQQEFLRANHHCISPWMYSELQIKQRNHALFLMEFDRASKVRT